ncbi:MAG: hypothetical protein ABIG90_02110 [bacterium]
MLKKLAHAYLFVGKNLTNKALRFAKKIQDNNLDLHITDSQGSIKIEQIRDLQKQLSLKPYSGKYKIAVIPEAQLMTNQAQNALLKTLEEPSGQAVLILISLSEYLLLPTIVSRCQVKRFYQKVPDVQKLGENLDDWIIYYRNKLIKHQSKNYLEFLKKVIKIRNLLDSTNINKNLAMDNLEIAKNLLNI